MTMCPALRWALSTEWNETERLALSRRVNMISWGSKGFPNEGPFELGIKG